MSNASIEIDSLISDMLTKYAKPNQGRKPEALVMITDEQYERSQKRLGICPKCGTWCDGDCNA